MISQVLNVSKEAGKIRRSHYSKKDIIEYKYDESPLTKADIKSSKFVIYSL